jgi:hypothetical protein
MDSHLGPDQPRYIEDDEEGEGRDEVAVEGQHDLRRALGYVVGPEAIKVDRVVRRLPSGDGASEDAWVHAVAVEEAVVLA